MEEFVIKRRIEIDAAHRVPDHKSKCYHIHGHRYVINAIAKGELHPSGEQRGMVTDFGFLKEVMMKRIHDRCDHGIIIWEGDDVLQQTLGIYPDQDSEEYPRHLKVEWLSVVPTAENLAQYWFQLMENDVRIISEGKARLVGVEVYETPNCMANYATESYS